MQTFLPCFQLFAQGHGWGGGGGEGEGDPSVVRINVPYPGIDLGAVNYIVSLRTIVPVPVPFFLGHYSYRTGPMSQGLYDYISFIRVRKMTSRIRTTLCYLINSRSVIPFLDYYENCRIIEKYCRGWFFSYCTDPACHLDADAEPDPDSTFHFDAAPNPAPRFQIKAQKTSVIAQMAHFPYILAGHVQTDEDPDLDPAYHVDAEPDNTI